MLRITGLIPGSVTVTVKLSVIVAFPSTITCGSLTATVDNSVAVASSWTSIALSVAAGAISMAAPALFIVSKLDQSTVVDVGVVSYSDCPAQLPAASKVSFSWSSV